MAVPHCLSVEPDLLVTDRPTHRSACHRWEDLVGLSDELRAFRRPDDAEGVS
jgi:hypothetical protein